MELVSIEPTRLISLFDVTRPAGQLFLPDAAMALVSRYSFVGFPTKFVDVESFEFQLGKFNDGAIDNFTVYRDGISITSRSNTNFLDGFYDDLLKWLESAFGVVRIETNPVNRFYESNLVVTSKIDLLTSMQDTAPIGAMVSRKLHETSDLKLDFKPISIALGFDATRVAGVKPIFFRVERRAGVDFSLDRFFSSAPLRTDDHLAVLNQLESLL